MPSGNGYIELDLAWDDQKFYEGQKIIDDFEAGAEDLVHVSGGCCVGGLRDQQLEVTSGSLETARKYQKMIRKLFREGDVRLDYCTINVHRMETMEENADDEGA